MAKSNQVLIASIVALVAVLGDEDAVTEGLSNAELVTLESGLKTRKAEADAKAKAEADAKAKAEADAKAKAEADAKAKVKKAPYTVAPGKSITSKRGIRGEGDEVRAEDFPGGENTLKSLVKRKLIIKN